MFLAIAAVVTLYWRSISGIVDLWAYDGFRHGPLIPVVSAFLLWRNRDELCRQRFEGSWIGCLLLVGAVWLWLVARQTMVQVAEQIAVLCILHAAVFGVFGWAAYKQSTFALSYLILSIPLGLDSIPWLMHVTAAITSVGLQAMGMPVLREGMYFTLPGGQFEIATACSGFRYLNAALALSVLMAYLSFASMTKRIAFVAVAVVAVVFMNGIRAMSIIAIASKTEMQYMTGVDHVWFGWFLFMLYVMCLYALVERFADVRRS
jgi:exosortase A